MISIKNVSVAVFSLLLSCGFSATAQEDNKNYNENSVYPINKEDQLFRKRIWRRLDLKEKQNQPLFSKNNEITRFLINHVLDGSLTPYKGDSLTSTFTIAEFREAIKIPTGSVEGDIFASSDDQGAAIEEFYFPKNFSILEMMEDVIFDKVRSRLYFDIQSICMWLPARDKDQTVDTPLDEPIAFFKYKELEKLFRENPTEAIWYNRVNPAEHKNIADAFLLRLFKGRIIKVDNPSDALLEDIYSTQRQALYASQEEEFKLMEMEHNLWEY